MIMQKAKESKLFPTDPEKIKMLPVFIGLSDEVIKDDKKRGKFTALSSYYDNPNFFVCRRFYKPISTIFH